MAVIEQPGVLNRMLVGLIGVLRDPKVLGSNPKELSES